MKNNVKRILCLVFIGLIFCGILLLFAGCGNRQMVDTTYTFDRAIIQLPNDKIVEGKLESWRDFSNSDQLQVKIDGKTYLVHSANCVLIANGENK